MRFAISHCRVRTSNFQLARHTSIILHPQRMPHSTYATGTRTPGNMFVRVLGHLNTFILLSAIASFFLATRVVNHPEHRASKIMTDLPSYTFPEVIHQSWKNCSKFKLVVHDVLRDIWRANHPSWQYICWNDTENRYKLPPHLLLGLIPKQFTSLSHKCIDQGSSGKTLSRFPQTV